MDPTTKLVSQLVSAEECYVNTAHPDFIGGHRALGLVTDKLQTKNSAASPNLDKDKLEKYDPKRTTVVPTGTASSGNTYQLDGGSSDAGIFGSFFSGKSKTTRRPGVLEPPPAVLKATGSVSEREYIEIEVISTSNHISSHV